MAFDVNTKIKDLMANPEAKAVIAKYIPGFWENPQSKQAFGMSLKVMTSFPQSKAIKEVLPQILEELAKIP
jgi:hypothetical protein